MRALNVGFLLLLSVFVVDAAAQRPQQQPTPPTLPGTLKGLPTLVVRVRDAMGVPLAGQALVRLYSNFTTVQLTWPTRDNGQAIFTDIPPGNYRVEVRASGYETTDEEVFVAVGGTSYAFINLRPESAVKPATIPASPALLTPKARKEVEKGLKALQANDLKEAQKRLRRAFKLAPGHPDVNYLLGVLYLRLNDSDQAKRHLEKAVAFHPDHAAALTALGALFYHQHDFPGVIRVLERALVLDPASWQGHSTIARAYYAESQFEKACTHAERALELGKDKAPDVQVLLGQVLVALGQREEAAQELESFLRRHPQHRAAATARRLLEQLREQREDSARPAARAQSADLVAPVEAAAASLAPLPTQRWAPPDVDKAVPPVATDVSCSLPQVLTAAGRQTSVLVKNLQQFTATERIEYTKLDEAGNVRFTEAQEVNYLVFIREMRAGNLAVREVRDGRRTSASFPTETRGLAALAMIFHPYYVDDFAMRCEGLGQWHGQPVWQVYFRQREDRPARILVYRSKEGRFPTPLKGRAWIAANTYDILRLEMDLVEPIKKIDLERQHFIVEYEPVLFAKRNLRLWLPASAELYLQLHGRRYRHQHSFSDFRLFSVEVNEKIQEYSQP